MFSTISNIYKYSLNKLGGQKGIGANSVCILSNLETPNVVTGRQTLNL